MRLIAIVVLCVFGSAPAHASKIADFLKRTRDWRIARFVENVHLMHGEPGADPKEQSVSEFTAGNSSATASFVEREMINRLQPQNEAELAMIREAAARSEDKTARQMIGFAGDLYGKPGASPEEIVDSIKDRPAKEFFGEVFSTMGYRTSCSSNLTPPGSKELPKEPPKRSSGRSGPRLIQLF